MESRYTFWLSAVSAPLAIVLMTIVLAGCRGVVAGSGPPPPPGNVTMSVTVTGTGTGTVTSTPAGINCPTTCSATFPQNSQVTLTETPGTSGAFSGWSGACTGTAACSVTLSAADSVTATFAATLQTINHIVVFAQENRSFDHYFGAMREYWAQNGYRRSVLRRLAAVQPGQRDRSPAGTRSRNHGLQSRRSVHTALR